MISDNEKNCKNSLDKLEQRRWSDKDEYFHLNKFLSFFGPYNRNIDPPINLGQYENKYSLHSRMMHYFTPPLQSAVSILLKKNVKGKLEALKLAQGITKELIVIDEIIDIVNMHYDKPALYREPALTELEKRLFQGLNLMKEKLEHVITIVPNYQKKDITGWKNALAKTDKDPFNTIFHYTRFCRLMKGRLFFYANAPKHFDNIPLIQNELKRIGEWFYRIPYRTYWEATRGEKLENPDDIIPFLVPDILTPEEASATLKYSQLTFGSWKGVEEETCKKIIPVYDDFFRGICKILSILKENMELKR